MAKKRSVLNEKNVSMIFENPFRVRQSDFSGEALELLLKVRKDIHTANKRKRTLQEKKVYEDIKTNRSKRKVKNIGNFISDIIAEKGMTEKKGRKKFSKAVEKIESKEIFKVWREIDVAKLDIKFAKKGTKFYNRETKHSRIKIHYLLTRLKNALMQTDLIYPQVLVYITMSSIAMKFNIPTPSEIKESGIDGEDLLMWVKENYDVDFYFK